MDQAKEMAKIAFEALHIFDRENRQFYNLERIWNDGKKIDDVNEF